MRTSGELGRRILSALISYLEGRAGVDSTLKRLREQPIDPKWTAMGEECLRHLVEKIPYVVEGKPRTSHKKGKVH